MDRLIILPEMLGSELSLAVAAEDAVSAISTLSGRISVSSVRGAWQRRAAWQGYARAMQLQGSEIDDVDVFGWGCGLPLPGRPKRITLVDEFAAFAPWWEQMLETDQAGWRDRLPFTPEISRELPRLFQALGITRQYALRDQGIDAWLALPIIIHRLGLTSGPLPCLVAGSKSFRLTARPAVETVRATCRALASAAQRGTTMLDELEAAYKASLRAISREYRAGKLTNLLALSLTMGVLSPARVASELELSVAGATKLLDRAAGLDLLTEISGRRSWKTYATKDLAIAFGFRKASPGRPRREPTLDVHDKALAGTIDDFDREMAAIEEKLQSLGTAGRA
jgi:hypothetical protein